MERRTFPIRSGDRHQEIGFGYGAETSTDGLPYWTEGAAYEFTLAEIEAIEEATERLHEICMRHAESIVASGDYPEEYGFSDAAKAAIERSWTRGHKHVYGRFDLLFSEGRIKLYEYNADTPTALLEAAVAQWDWLEASPVPNRDQFNSIHEKLVARWAELVPPGSRLHLFATREGPSEDWGNIQYMAETAYQAGIEIYVDEIESITHESTGFCDAEGGEIIHAFKLYPWEWMFDDPFGELLPDSGVRWFEPAWKLLLSHKALLPLLWHRYPGEEYLLPAYFEEVDGFIQKPVLGREGANVKRRGALIEGSLHVPEYDNGYIYQAYDPRPEFDGWHPVIGSWMIGDEPAGIGIREDRTLVSGNGSHFIPHYFV